MLERLIEHIMKHEGTKFLTFDAMAEDFKRRSPRKK